MEDLLWWGLNLASMGVSRFLLPWLEGLSIAAAWGLDAAGWGALGVAPDLADRVARAIRRIDLAAQKQAAERLGATLVGFRDPRYPRRLRDIEDPPLALAMLGNAGVLEASSAIAVVGARRATQYGREVSWQFGHQLARAGTLVVSGMAAGIDGRAHEGALDARGPTAAVLGCGLDICYPAELSDLRRRLVSDGLLLSQYSFGAPPLPHHFPYRNRLISGLSQGVLVVEGSMSSGSLHTVDWALQQGREVYAVPGSIYSKGSELPHHLMQMGARPVTSPQDLLPAALPTAPPAELNAAERQALAALGPAPASPDELAAQGEMSLSELLSALLSLEMHGLVSRSASNRYRRN